MITTIVGIGVGAVVAMLVIVDVAGRIAFMYEEPVTAERPVVADGPAPVAYVVEVYSTYTGKTTETKYPAAEAEAAADYCKDANGWPGFAACIIPLFDCELPKPQPKPRLTYVPEPGDPCPF